MFKKRGKKGQNCKKKQKQMMTSNVDKTACGKNIQKMI